MNFTFIVAKQNYELSSKVVTKAQAILYLFIQSVNYTF